MAPGVELGREITFGAEAIWRRYAVARDGRGE